MQSSASINLLKGRVNLLDEIVKWSLTIGRLLIITVELVAFTAFIVRFSLDRTLIDLHDKIRQEQAIVASLKDTEAKYRNLQERIKLADTAAVKGSRNVDLLTGVIDITPSEITFNSIGITNNQIAIDADVTSVPSMTSFITELRKNPNVSSVSIEGISSKTANASLNVLIQVRLTEADVTR